MSRKQKRYIPKSFESTGTTSDTSANIYMSMIMSENWQKLSKNQQLLYVYCKAQYYAEKRKPKPKLAQLSEQELAECFTMNKSKWCSLYHLYNNGNQNGFIKDMKALIDNGFIDIVENGKSTRSKSIYKLSNKWHK